MSKKGDDKFTERTRERYWVGGELEDEDLACQVSIPVSDNWGYCLADHIYHWILKRNKPQSVYPAA